MNFPKLSVKGIKTGLSKHSSEILLGFGITGMASSVVFAVKATPKALVLIEELKEEKEEGEEVKKTEIVKATWSCYLPTAGAMIFGITCLIGSNSIHRKRHAALAAAYSITDTAFRTYKDKAVDILGEKKESEIREAAAVEKVKKEPETAYVTGTGMTLCYDVISGRYFKSDIEKIRQAVNNVNYRMKYEDYIAVNDFYEEIGLGPIQIGNELGWHIDDGYLDVCFSSKLTGDGTPCLVLDYVAAPRYEFKNLF